MKATLKTFRIYLDSCCICRPYDEQTQSRVRCETAAIMQIISHCHNGELQWVDSAVLRFEINEISDLKKRSVVDSLLNSMPRVAFVSVDTTEILRGKQLEALGFKDRDASHIACAESGEADIFLTTDDGVIRKAKHMGSQLRVWVDNPDTWLQKFMVTGGN